MSKLIAPNGCKYCEREQWNHWSRLDGLHPSGVWTWVEPSGKLRLERMRRNRMIRKGVTMNYGWAYYLGATRKHIFGSGIKYRIADVSQDGLKVALDPGDGKKVEWMHINAVEYTTSPEKGQKLAELNRTASDFLEPNKETLSNLDAEIKRLEERLTALRAARAVVASL